MKKETAAMKGIAVGTLTFLPATFVSVSVLAEIPLNTLSDDIREVRFQHLFLQLSTSQWW